MFKFDKQNRPDIREVKASLMFPKYWNDNESKLTSINMRKDMFNRKHKDFIQDLEELKNKKYCQKCICVNALIRPHSAYTSRTLYGIKMNRELIRYWITLNQQERPIGFGLGIGITAYSEEDMLSILRDRIEQEIKIEKVQIIRSLDELEQNHVLPNMEEFVFRGMWYPKGFK